MKNTLIISVLLALNLILGGFLVKGWVDARKLQQISSQLNQELQKANLEIGRAHTEIADLSNSVDSFDSQVKKEVEARDAEVTRYAELEARYKVLVKNQKVTNIEIITGESVKNPQELEPESLYKTDSVGHLYPLTKLYGQWKDWRVTIDSVTIGHPISVQLSYEINLKLGMRLIETNSPSGAINHYAEVYELNPNGVEVGRLKLEKFEVKIENPDKAQMFWWCPRIDIAGLAAISIPVPSFGGGGSLGFSFSGYGKTMNDLDFRFFRLSVDIVNSMPAIGATPALWNLGQFIPFIHNLYIGIHYSFSILDQKQFVGIILGTTL